LSESEYKSHPAIERISDNLLNDALRKHDVERAGVKLGEVLRGPEKSVVGIAKQPKPYA